MEDSKKQELNLDDLSQAVGGACQNNSGNKGAQQNNQEGDNYNDNIQTNEVSGNKGNVTIYGPMSVKDNKGQVSVKIGS